MNTEPDSVCSTVLSRISLNNWTCGAISEPNVAVAMRQPPPWLVSSAALFGVTSSTMGTIDNNNCCLSTEFVFPKRYLRSSLLIPSAESYVLETKYHPFFCNSSALDAEPIILEFDLSICNSSSEKTIRLTIEFMG